MRWVTEPKADAIRWTFQVWEEITGGVARSERVSRARESWRVGWDGRRTLSWSHPGHSCPEGIHSKLVLRKGNMDHSVISGDGCHKGCESSVVREDCRCDGLHWQHLSWKQKENETVM